MSENDGAQVEGLFLGGALKTTQIYCGVEIEYIDVAKPGSKIFHIFTVWNTKWRDRVCIRPERIMRRE